MRLLKSGVSTGTKKKKKKVSLRSQRLELKKQVCSLSVCSGSSSSRRLLGLMILKAKQCCNHDNIMQIHSSPERAVCSPREKRVTPATCVPAYVALVFMCSHMWVCWLNYVSAPA